MTAYLQMSNSIQFLIQHGLPIMFGAVFLERIGLPLPAENQSFMRFLLSETAFHMRWTGGGVGVANLAHLAGYTVYPGVAQIPGDCWEAEPMAKEST